MPIECEDFYFDDDNYEDDWEYEEVEFPESYYEPEFDEFEDIDY